MAIISLTEVKSLNQISGSTYDSTISTLIPFVSDYISEFTKLTIEQIEKKPGLKIVAAQMIQHQLQKPNANVSSEAIGDYSVSYNNTYPQYIMDILDTYRTCNYITDAYYDIYNEAYVFNRIGVAEKRRWWKV